MAARLRQRGKLDGLPRLSGGRPNPRRIHRPLAPGPGRCGALVSRPRASAHRCATVTGAVANIWIGDDMEYDVRLETVASRNTAVVRRRVGQQQLPKVMPDACGVVWGVPRAQHVQGAGRHVSLYLDEAINLEVGVELEAPLSGAGHGEVVPSTLPAGRVATTT